MDEKKGTITRRTETALDRLQNEFTSLHTKDEFMQKLRYFYETKDRSALPFLMNELCRMFADCGIGCEPDRERSYYEELIKKLDIPEDQDELEDIILIKLFEIYREYPSPEEYLERLICRLENSEDSRKDDTLRLRILRRFIGYGNYLSDAGYKGKEHIIDYVKSRIGKEPSENDVMNCIDDGVFDILSENRKKYSLLSAADSLASGRFRTDATQKDLYFFAMAYGMTYDPAAPDPEKDIEINLFRDYYNNNLMRFISGEKQTHYEQDPSGRGINYKSYKEMIYLYFIAQELSPAEKIKKAGAMEKRVEKELKSRIKTKAGEPQQTVFYRNVFRGAAGRPPEDIFAYPEEKFEEFLKDNYALKDSDIKSQNTAYRVYRSVIRDLRSAPGVTDKDNFRYSLCFTDRNAFKKNKRSALLKKYSGLDPVRFSSFLELIDKINGHLVCMLTEDENASSENEKSRITRTKLLSAFYYLYNETKLYMRSETDSYRERYMTFKDVYEDFEDHANKLLNEAFYQPISSKNIFDVLMILSSYYYIEQ